MKRKYLFILAGIFSICLLSAYVLYDRYGKYLPTTASDVVFPTALTSAQIQSIRQNTPIDIIHVYKNQRYLVLQHQNDIHYTSIHYTKHKKLCQKIKKILDRPSVR